MCLRNLYGPGYKELWHGQVVNLNYRGIGQTENYSRIFHGLVYKLPKNLSAMMCHRGYQSQLVTRRMLAQDRAKSCSGYHVLAYPAGVRRLNCRVMFTEDFHVLRMVRKRVRIIVDVQGILPSASFVFEHWQWDFIFLSVGRALEARALHGILTELFVSRRGTTRFASS